MPANHWVAHAAIHGAESVGRPILRPLEQLGNSAMPTEIPDVDTLLDLAIRGWITEDQAQTWLKMHGVLLNSTGTVDLTGAIAEYKDRAALWNRTYWAKQELPTTGELFDLANRGLLSNADLDTALRRRGFYSSIVRGALENLRYEIPSSSDLVRFSVRHVFEPDLIARLGYNQEFRPILDMWHRFQGLNYPIFTGPFGEQVKTFEKDVGLPPGAFIQSYLDNGLTDPTWAQAFWWSHWVLPSPTQGYEMYFRLRPDRNRAFDPEFARDLDFGLEDLNLLLRANDYPPFYRSALAAIAHRIPGIRFLRQLRSTDVFKQEDVVELLLRQGYSPGDAAVLGEAVERNDRDVRRKAIEQQAKGQLARYWELGVIDKNEYVSLLQKHGLTPQDAADAADLAEIDLHADRVKKIIVYVKQQFIKGATDPDQTANLLRDAGVTPERAALYVADWGLEIRSKHRELSASQAYRMTCEGFLTLDDLSQRLANLGYAAGDIGLLVEETRACQAVRAARAASQQARAAQQNQALLKRAQREAAAALQSSRRQLALHGSPSQLRKWFCEGLIGQTEVYQRLSFLGWPPADIARLIGDCKSGSRAGTTKSGSGQSSPGGVTNGSTQASTGPAG